MKVALVISSFYPATVYGGPIFSTLHTSEALAKIDDLEIFVSTTNANMNSRLDVEIDKWHKFEENFFVKYYNDTKINFLSLSLLFNLWKDIKSADIVHVQYIFVTPTIIALFYANFFNKPAILSPRGSLCKWCLGQGSRFKKLWLKFLIKPFASNIVWHATAEIEKQDILDQFPNAKVDIVPNGITFNTYQTSNRLSKIGFCKTFIKKELKVDKIIVSMGRLQKKKGFDILIDVFSKVVEEYPKSKLFIAGDDEGEAFNLTAQLKNLNLENSVFLIGSIHGQEKIDFLANADLFVLPSHNENFGNVYVESLAAGTPIVASTGTPWREVEECNCGKWVDNSVDDTAQATIEMLK